MKKPVQQVAQPTKGKRRELDFIDSVWDEAQDVLFETKYEFDAQWEKNHRFDL